MKKTTLLILNLLLALFFTFGQEIHFKQSVISNSVALHPQIFDVNKDSKN